MDFKHSKMPSRQRSDPYPHSDDDRSYYKTNIISRDCKMNNQNNSNDKPKLKHNRSFGGFEHMYDPIPDLQRKRSSGVSLNSRQFKRGSWTPQFSQSRRDNVFTRINEDKTFTSLSENRHMKVGLDFRIEPINESEKGIEILMPETCKSDKIHHNYDSPIQVLTETKSERNVRKYERKISCSGFSDPGTHCLASSQTSEKLDQDIKITAIIKDSKSSFNKEQSQNLDLNESNSATKDQRVLEPGKSLDSLQTTSITSDNQTSQKQNVIEQSQSLDTNPNPRKSRGLTRQKTFRMDSVEMIEALLGATTFRNSNNVTFPSNHIPRGKKPPVKRNSAPDNIRATVSHHKRNSQPTTNQLQDYRLVVLGSGAVGKSSLVTQFLNGFFPHQYKPTVEDSYRHLVQLPDGVFHTIEILDTAGLHQFPAMRRLSILSGDAFIVVFSLDSRESFKEALILIQLIFETKGINPSKERVPIILVGNKSDLEDTREVTHEEAVASALEKNLCAYLQTSAKHNENVQQLFSELLIHTFGVQEQLEAKSTKKSSSFKELKKQLSDKVLGIGRRHHSDSEATSCAQRSNFNPGCTLSDPACTIL